MDNTHAAILEALHQVPPTHLSIYDLWKDLVNRDGNLDTLRAIERAEEVQTAVDQVEAYVRDTQAVLQHLKETMR